MYNIAAIKAKLNSSAKSSSEGSGGRATFWKATMGEHDVRFLPYANANGEPFEEVRYYKEPLVDNRIVAPSTYGLPDPIKDIFEVRRKLRDKEEWKITKLLQPQERYFAVVLVRSEEEKGPQIWEMSKDIRDDIYKTLAHKDNADENMFDAEVGYDFTINVAQALDPSGKPRSFNNYPVKKYNITARKKPSKLHAKPAQAKAWLEAMPKLGEFFRNQVKSAEDIQALLDNFIARNSGDSAPSGTDTNHAVHHGVSADDMAKAANKVDEAFKDLL